MNWFGWSELLQSERDEIEAEALGEKLHDDLPHYVERDLDDWLHDIICVAADDIGMPDDFLKVDNFRERALEALHQAVHQRLRTIAVSRDGNDVRDVTVRMIGGGLGLLPWVVGVTGKDQAVTLIGCEWYDMTLMGGIDKWGL